MRIVSMLSLAFLLEGVCWAQFTPAQFQRVKEAQKELRSKITTPIKTLSTSPYARTHGTYVIDSLYSDLYDGRTSSWQEYLLRTYDYYPNTTLIRVDSLFRKDGGNWVDSAETRYYYTTGGRDSIHVIYVSPNGTAWEPSDSIVFSYTTNGSVTLRTIVYYKYENATWKEDERERTWFSNGSPDSMSVERYDRNSNAWAEYLRLRYKYAGNLLDSIIARFDLDPFEVIYVRNYRYDASNRPNYIRDTAYISLGQGSATFPLIAQDEYITYTTSTSRQIAVDSIVIRDYESDPPTQSVYVDRYSYDANNNLETIVYEECAPACEPYSRDRFAYKLVPSALVPGKGGTYSLCGRSCESLTLPQNWEGLAYELYNLGGQRLSHGTLGSNFTLPAQPGLYILLTRGQAYRLQVLP